MRPLRPGEPIADLLAPYEVVDRSRPAGPCWVLTNMVCGLDGTAAIGGRVGALSEPADAELFRLLRAVADVVLVGAETVRREGYGPVRLPEARRQRRQQQGRAPVPRLAVVSRSLDLDWSAPAFTGADPAARTLVVTCEAADPARLAAAQAVGTVDVVVAGDERVDPAHALHELAALGARTVLCEGGPTLLGELVAADLVDELCLTVAPVMGGDPLPVSVTPAGAALRRFRLAATAVDADTLFLRYERVPGGAGDE